MTVDEVYPKVRDALVRSGNLNREQINLDSRLVGDLGLESLDLIDLVYELEQVFDITIPMGNLEAKIEEAMDGEDYQVDGILTPAGLNQLRRMVPGLVVEGLSDEIGVDEVPLMLTVRSVCALLVQEQERIGRTRSTT